MLLFFTHSALGEWESYRSAVGKAANCGLRTIDYSTFFTVNGQGLNFMLHLNSVMEQPVQVIETIGNVHDGPIGEQLADKSYILVQDRAYGKIKRLDQYAREQQYR